MGGADLVLAGCPVPPSPIPPQEISTEINAPGIEWLIFDQKTLTYFAEAYNPYGLITNEKAGVIVKGGVEINGTPENVLGLRPEVLGPITEQYGNGIKFAFPFNFEQNRGIKITELVQKDPTELPENRHRILGMKIPKPTLFYSPISCRYLYLRTRPESYGGNSIGSHYPYFQLFLPESNFWSTDGNTWSKAWFDNGEWWPSDFDISSGTWNSINSDAWVINEVKIGQVLGAINNNAHLEPLTNKILYENAGEYQLGFFSVWGGLERILKIGDYRVFTLPKQ